MASSVNNIGAVNTSSNDGGDGTREGKVRTRRGAGWKPRSHCWIVPVSEKSSFKTAKGDCVRGPSRPPKSVPPSSPWDDPRSINAPGGFLGVPRSSGSRFWPKQCPKTVENRRFSGIVLVAQVSSSRPQNDWVGPNWDVWDSQMSPGTMMWCDLDPHLGSVSRTQWISRVLRPTQASYLVWMSVSVRGARGLSLPRKCACKLQSEVCRLPYNEGNSSFMSTTEEPV